MSAVDVVPQEAKSKEFRCSFDANQAQCIYKEGTAPFFFLFFPLKSRIKEDTVSFCNQLNKITEKLLTSLLTFPLSWNNLGQLLWLIMEKVKTFNHKKNMMPRLLIDFL